MKPLTVQEEYDLLREANTMVSFLAWTWQDGKLSHQRWTRTAQGYIIPAELYDGDED